MKVLLFALVVTMFLSLSGHTQSIPEGATGIDLQTSTADSSLYRAVQGFLETQEYIIEDADEAQYTLATERREEREQHTNSGAGERREWHRPFHGRRANAIR